MATSDLLEQARVLHSPQEASLGPQCGGCDVGGYDSAAPDWPCRTAELIYGVEEIADWLEADRLWRKWKRPHDYRKQMASSWGLDNGISRFIRDVYARQIMAQLQPLFRLESTSTEIGNH